MQFQHVANSKLYRTSVKEEIRAVRFRSAKTGISRGEKQGFPSRNPWAKTYALINIC